MLRFNSVLRISKPFIRCDYHMNFRDWIYSFIGHVPSPFGKPARWIADRLYGILDDGVKFARWIGKGAGAMAARGVVYVALALSFAVETGATLKWICLVEIPRRATAALSAAQKWAMPIINAVKTTLQGAINGLSDWARKRVAEIVNAATALRNWASGQINGVKDYLNNTVGKWYERLTSPTKFAEWVIGAIVNAALRYVYTNRDKLARYILQSSPSTTLWFARQLESIIGKLL
jgi:hypothetical protein